MIATFLAFVWIYGWMKNCTLQLFCGHSSVHMCPKQWAVRCVNYATHIWWKGCVSVHWKVPFMSLSMERFWFCQNWQPVVIRDSSNLPIDHASYSLLICCPWFMSRSSCDNFAVALVNFSPGLLAPVISLGCLPPPSLSNVSLPAFVTVWSGMRQQCEQCKRGGICGCMSSNLCPCFGLICGLCYDL